MSILRASVVPAGIAQGAADIPAIAWMLIVGAWVILLVAGVGWALRHRGRVAEGEILTGEEARLPDQGSERMRDLVESLASGDEATSGVLRWLVRETESVAAVYLELSPANGERILVAPRGLPHEAVVGLVARAREELTAPAHAVAADPAVVRWLGVGGSKCIVLADPVRHDEEALRFARYMLEWLRSVGGQPVPHSEGSIREIPGVAWAEERGEELLLVLAEGVDRNEVASRVHRMLAGSGLRTRWLEPAAPLRSMGPSEEGGAPVEEQESPPAATALGSDDARVRILEVALSANGRVTADVRVTWNDFELRGRGHGGPSEGGRHFASALAVADALRPLLDSDIEIRGLYTARTQGRADVMIADVELEGQHLVGAVLVDEEARDLTGARAVLDAVNRRLTQLAGRSGRI